MALVTVKINGFAHTVGCEDGQEGHLEAMANEVERRIESIQAVASQGGALQSGEARLLALAALMLADETHDLRMERDKLKAQVARAKAKAPAEPSAALPATSPATSRRLSAIALRAEDIAADTERA